MYYQGKFLSDRRMNLSWSIKNRFFGLFIMISHWETSPESHSKHLQLACSFSWIHWKWCSSALCQDLGKAQCPISFISIDYLIDCCVSMFITQSFKGVVQHYVVFLKGFNQSQQLTLVHSVKEKQESTFEEKLLQTNQKLKWWNLEEEKWVSELPLGLTHCFALWKQKKIFFVKNFQMWRFFFPCSVLTLWGPLVPGKFKLK